MKELYCYYNQLTELILSDLTSLETLLCDVNQLTEIDVSSLTALVDLSCCFNQLTVLDVNSLTALKELYCFNNKLANLNLSGLTTLKTLYCNNYDEISLSSTELDEPGSKNKKLTKHKLNDIKTMSDPQLFYNELTSIILNGCVNLEEIYADNQHVSVQLSGSNYKNPLNFIGPNGQSIPVTINGVQYSQNDDLPNNLGANLQFSFNHPAGITGDPFSGTITLSGYTPPPTIVAVTGVTVSPSNLSLTVGEGTITLTATIAPDNATNQNVKWKSSDESIALVNSTGVVAPVSAGNAVITATTEDGDKIDFCMVTVSPAVGNDNVGYNSFTVYPNPTSRAINVTGLTPGKTIKLYSVIGALVGAYTAQEEAMTINLDNLSSGMYFLNFEGKTIRVIKK